MLIFFSFLSSLIVTMVLIPPLMKMAERMNIIDIPDERKVHAIAIPRIGGVAMVVGVITAMLVWMPMTGQIYALLAGVIVLAIFGMWDDCTDLDYRIKFIGQFLAILIVVYLGDVVFSRVPFISAEYWFYTPACIFTLIFLVGVTNAFNLADGLDGLAAGLTLLSLAGVAILSYLSDGYVVLFLALAVIGAIIGFLRFNTHPAVIFMGDTGSQFLGFSVGILSVLLTQQENTALSPVLPILLLGLPILDTLMVMTRRIYEGRSPFSPDKTHFHHKLLNLGFDQTESVVIIYLVQVSFVITALLMRYESDALLLVIYVTACLLIVGLLEWAARVNWRVHESGTQSWIQNLLNRLESNVVIHGLPQKIISSLLSILFLVSAFFVTDIPYDLGIGAAIVGVLLFLRLVFGYTLWFLFLRLMIFVTGTFVVYLTGIYQPGLSLYPPMTEYIFYGVVFVLLIIGIRFSSEDRFKLNPTDYLLVFAVFALAAVSEQNLHEYKVLSNIIKMMVLFYASEFILRRMTSRWNVFTVSSLLCLGVIGVRGLL
ncbi:MAG: undecaprenyl/decaprenyl-phosphate alpha-N-acetylglucosaminyl 1-phosphate transferase [Gammaproteobacteria bacterium]|nr:undecaprenyl/decaprenyl-phosphate alpha-N-acetylglucosaminyl 1-phosphate transferase [Gammaproteobacteria bacterium]